MTDPKHPDSETGEQPEVPPRPGYVDPRSPTDENESKKFGPIQRLAVLMNATAEELTKISEDTPIRNLGSGEDTRRYINAAGEGAQISWEDGQYEHAFDRPDSEWVQVVESHGDRLAMAKPGLSPGAEGTLSGDMAQFLATEALGKGSMVQVPLWRSGIWLTLRTPRLVDLVELDRRLSTNKVDLGRDLYGNIFSNNMVYTIGTLVDFALDHVYTTTTKDRRKTTLKRLILSTDLMQMMNALTATIYPKGYPMEQPCVANIETCNHIDRGTVNLVKLSWTDRSALSEDQLRHMGNREARHTEEDILTYQNAHQKGYTETLDLTDQFRMVFKEPSLDRYLRSGYDWVASVLKSSERVFDKDASERERNQYIETQATTTAMRRWAHWVDKLMLGDKEIRDPGTITQIISDVISPDGEYRDAMGQSVKQLVDDATITLIGIPRYKCPGCGEEPQGHPQYPALMALNPVSAFLLLLGQRLITLIETQ